MFLTNKDRKFHRQSYTFLDLMAEMGGFAKTIFASIAVFLAPLTQFTFYTSTIQHLFMKMEQKEKK